MKACERPEFVYNFRPGQPCAGLKNQTVEQSHRIMSETTLTNRTVPAWREYLALCKPRVVSLIIFTAIVGMLLSTPGAIPLDIFVFATLGIALAAGSAAAINHVADNRIDALMARTRDRPLPQGEISRPHALLFALSIGAIAMYLLVVFVNVLTAVLTFADRKSVV